MTVFMPYALLPGLYTITGFPCTTGVSVLPVLWDSRESIKQRARQAVIPAAPWQMHNATN